MQILQNRLIAFLDILGFSARLKDTSLENLYKQLSGFLDDAKTKAHFDPQATSPSDNFETAQLLSDSLIIVSKEVNTLKHVCDFIASIGFLQEIGFSHNLPLRGAISKGDFLFDDERNIFLSKVFPSMLNYEKSQEWPGCVILEPALDLVLRSIYGEAINFDAMELSQSFPVLRFDIPLKNGLTEKGWCINFVHFLPPSIIKLGMAYLISPKKENLGNFINYVSSLKNDSQALPPQLAPAVLLKVLKMRTGFRMGFFDIDGNPCDPKGEFTITVA